MDCFESLSYDSTTQHSLLGLLLVTGLLLLLILLVGRLGHVDVFESLELLDKEGSHDSLLDLSAGKVSTVGSADMSLGGSESLESMWSGDLDSLHFGSLGVLFDEVQDELTT